MKKKLIITGLITAGIVAGGILARGNHGGTIPPKSAVAIIMKSSDVDVDNVIAYVQHIKVTDPDVKVYVAYTVTANRTSLNRLLSLADGSVGFGRDLDDSLLVPYFQEKIRENGANEGRLKIMMVRPNTLPDPYTFEDL